MWKKGTWFSAVKKALSFDSKEKTEKKSRRPLRWFSRQSSRNLESSNAENPAVVDVPARAGAANPPVAEVKLKEAEKEQNRHAYSVAFVTTMAAEAALAAAQAAAEVVRLRAVVASNPGKSKTEEEMAAIKIQTAFRGYLARRMLRALRGLGRVKTLIRGKSIKRQAVSSLKRMQSLARLQTEVRARRIKTSQEVSAIQQLIQQTHENELHGKSHEEWPEMSRRVSIRENWDDSMQSKEKVEAKVHHRQEAAMRRQRALAYECSHQQTKRYSSSPATQTFMDPNNPRWGWSLLERWVANRLSENENTVLDKEPNTHTDPVSPNTTKIQSPTARKLSLSPSEQKLVHSPTARKLSLSPLEQKLLHSPTAQKLSLSPTEQKLSLSPTERKLSQSTTDQNLSQSPTARKLSQSPTEQKLFQSPKAQKLSRPPSSPSTPKSKVENQVRPSSSRGTVNATDDDSKSTHSIRSGHYQRRSCTSLSLNDESFCSSPRVPGYMAPTESAIARLRLGSPRGGPDKVSPDSFPKKRLSFSFSWSPGRARR